MSKPSMVLAGCARPTRMPGWEQEFWHYVSNGDGISCPLHETCKLLEHKCSCPLKVADSEESDSVTICQPETNYTLKPAANSECQSNIGFIEGLRPGRIFELLDLLSRSWLKKAKVFCPPVPSELIYLLDDEHRIEVRSVPLKAYGGAIWKIDDSWIIHINANDSPFMQRFNLFHEAFHILAHCRATPVFKKRGRTEGSFNEILADNFALHILMPARWVLKLWEASPDAAYLSDKFKVPVPIVIDRLQSLNLIHKKSSNT